MNALDISAQALLIAYLLILVPLAVVWYTEAPLKKRMGIAAGRMSLQLLLVALYLKFLFDRDLWWLNALWIIVMIVAANDAIMRGAGIQGTRAFLTLLPGFALVTLPILALVLVLVLRPDPIWQARYLIPIMGMLLGNSLRSNIIGLERCYSSLGKCEEQYVAALMMGASRKEALRPFWTESIVAALSPAVARMATMGLVSLPGMMTGQILGGSSPVLAIKYQIVIILAILASTALSVFTSLWLSRYTFFDSRDLLRRSLFR